MAIVTRTIQRQPPREKRPIPQWTDEPRVDLHAKVTGEAQYVEDMPEPVGTIFVAAIRSPYSHARVKGIDASRAQQLPGVLGILDRDHLPEFVHVPEDKTDQHFITLDKARFDGDLIGMVAASDLRTARRAAELVEVDYELLPPLFSAREALAPGAPLVHEQLGHNVAVEDGLEWGDVERGFDDADEIVEEAYFSPNVYHHPMEPAMSFLVEATDSMVEIWLPTNNLFDVIEHTTEVFGLERSQVRVRSPFVGGNFGAKHFAPEALAAAALSRLIGRPAKFVATDEESFRATARHAMEYSARLGVKSDGRLVALDVNLEIDTGAYITGGRVATRNAVQASFGAYQLPHFRVRATTAYTNKVPAGYFRNTGKNQTTFGVECVIDSAARKLGIDPIEFRRRNAIRRGEYITDTWRVYGEDQRVVYSRLARRERDTGPTRGEEMVADTPPVDTDFDELMQRAVEGIGWDGSAAKPMADSKERVARGRGMAISMRRGSAAGGKAQASVSVGTDGVVTIRHNAPDVGEGSYNMMSVVASHALGVPLKDIQMTDPDTGNELFFSGVSSQRTTVQMGNAVYRACEQVKQQLLEATAKMKGGSAEEWSIADGRLQKGDASYSLAEIASALEGKEELQSVGTYTPASAEDKAFGGLDHWAPGAAAAEVEVDRETGEVRVVRYASVADGGKILHYKAARGQTEGGAVMGLGITLFEELHYEEGQLLNADPFQYRLPLMQDIPEAFNVSFVENGDGPGPFGSKGMAQTSIPCAAPAVCNAIYDALGVRVYSTPFTPEKVLKALGKLGGEG